MQSKIQIRDSGHSQTTLKLTNLRSYDRPRHSYKLVTSSNRCGHWWVELVKRRGQHEQTRWRDELTKEVDLLKRWVELAIRRVTRKTTTRLEEKVKRQNETTSRTFCPPRSTFLVKRALRLPVIQMKGIVIRVMLLLAIFISNSSFRWRYTCWWRSGWSLL